MSISQPGLPACAEIVPGFQKLPWTMADSEEDWQNLTDAATRRRIQNRIAQRNYRRNTRKRLKELEEQLGINSTRRELSTTSNGIVVPRRRKSLLESHTDVVSAPLRDNKTKRQRPSHKRMQSTPNLDRQENLLNEDDQSKQSLLNSNGALETSYGPSEAIWPAETIPSLDQGMPWSFPTPFPTPDGSVSYHALNSEWPVTGSLQHSTSHFSNNMGFSRRSKDTETEATENMAELEFSCLGGQTTLHLAARKGHQTIVAMLLDKDGNVDDTDILGQSALHLAAAEGHQPVIQTLLERGAQIYLQDTHGQTPLHLAAEKGHLLTVQYLLQQGLMNEVKDTLGRTPLHVAVEFGHEDIVQMLLENGADPRARLNP